MKADHKHRVLRRILLVLALPLLLSNCGPPAEETSEENAPNNAEQIPSQTTTPPPESNVARTTAAEIDEPSIQTHLAYLTGASPAPLSSGEVTIFDRGSESGRRAAAEYMKESFEAAGVPARVLEFVSGERRGFNVEAILRGSARGTADEQHLWVTAHLDSFNNPGANDDGTGLVSLLMTAAALEGLETPEHTVHFVAYDLEEVGLVGSAVYVGSEVSAVQERQGDSAILGNLHSDMIGYDANGSHAIMATCNQAGPIEEAIREAHEQLSSPLDLDEDCLRRSDHEHFWDAGLPAVIMTDSARYDGYPWYHDPEDTPDKLNIPYLRSVIQLNAATTALLITEGQ